MEELFEVAKKITDWKNLVKIDNTNDNPLIDAYNEGVDAMAAQFANFINAIITAKGGEQ